MPEKIEGFHVWLKKDGNIVASIDLYGGLWIKRSPIKLEKFNEGQPWGAYRVIEGDVPKETWHKVFRLMEKGEAAGEVDGYQFGFQNHGAKGSSYTDSGTEVW